MTFKTRQNMSVFGEKMKEKLKISTNVVDVSSLQIYNKFMLTC